MDFSYAQSKPWLKTTYFLFIMNNLKKISELFYSNCFPLMITFFCFFGNFFEISLY